MSRKYEVLIIGGGTAGLSVAARLRNAANPPEVAIIEPSDKHYYQPLWTLVGAGIFPKEVTERPEADYIPEGATWIRDKVASFDPENNAVTTASGEAIQYDYLVVAAGIQLDWNKVDGLKEAIGKNGVVSNYAYDTVDSTWAAIRGFKGGKALFTFPNTPIKCAGAPQKIMWLAEESFRRTNVRSKSEVIFASAGAAIFGVPKYKLALEKIIAERDIHTAFRHDLVAIRADKKQAVFRHLDENKEVVMDYEMIHVTPPQSSPEFIAKSKLANAGGWVDVDKHTMQHVRYPNVFSLGDCSSLPCSKTGAAIRKQAPIMVENLLAVRAHKAATGSYDGYASCPLITGYGTCILAEFNYDGDPTETFDFDQAQERYSMYALKAYALPKIYWHGMLRGRM
ncbi:MAG: NAD(P)/FAD-dependent oxidoreductase [Myxococcales bacterium]|nr:NAD(P)/FAD-dependent oxidoreductase [Myxococcales bacterium]